jgi:rhamnogalacturonan endolyase
MLNKLLLLLILSQSLLAQRQMEYLNRGAVAVANAEGGMLISWRLLGNDPVSIAFNVYRGQQKLNGKPLTVTNFVDKTPTEGAVYHIKTVLKGVEQKNAATTLSLKQAYLEIPLQIPAGGTTPDGKAYTYNANDASAGDLDGDGEYEIILKWEPSNAKDNSQNGYTGNVFLDAYKLNGTRLWQIDLGKNIRAGAHYTQFMVYDLDGDGQTEIACKTADGTTDGKGKIIGDATKDYRNAEGRILEGAEFFTVFNGQTGEALATTDYLPNRFPIDSWGTPEHNDRNGNRADRFLACVAYLDGKQPSVIMCRGYYARTVLAAWDWRNGKLTLRWVFDTKNGFSQYEGQGNHNLTAADVDNDGNGKGLFTTGFGHGDAIHVSDLDPTHEGLEVFGIHENKDNDANRPGMALYDAKTGKTLVRTAEGKDVGRGVAADIDPAHLGAELWGGMVVDGKSRLLNVKGEDIGEAPKSANFLAWWDGDLSRELLDGNHIDKYKAGRLLTAEGCTSNNGTKSTPALSADLWGDWREEVVLRTNDNKSLRIYTTTIPTEHRLITLMHDPQYRLSVAAQNVAYNQPPHTSYYLGTGMKKAPRTIIKIIKR